MHMGTKVFRKAEGMPKSLKSESDKEGKGML